ncbi:MAG: toxin co-regulated pilus biosynthesis Q family protein [Alphaproteobacteria bacterium]|nr:toxin co-regulated pilus biosynthesis Q family protein [Alphaproteobacteria bacterium]
MFRKILIAAMFGCAAGYCFAATTGMPQAVTAEVFYTQDKTVDENRYVEQNDWNAVTAENFGNQYVERAEQTEQVVEIPAWPIAGSDADVEVSCSEGACSKNKKSDNIRIVSKIGEDLVVENNFNLGPRGDFGGWSGGANMLHGTQIPVGFDNDCENGSEMPLLHREVLEDDGGNVLAMSRSGRKNCNRYSDGYTAYLAKNGLTKAMVAEKQAASMGMDADAFMSAEEETEIGVDVSADAEAPVVLKDQVRSWVVASGQTLREVLQSWCNKEGWDLVWTTSREYPIEASAVFKGRFVDVASALVRNFGRAMPIPYAKFYKGNRVLVISTTEE